MSDTLSEVIVFELEALRAIYGDESIKWVPHTLDINHNAASYLGTIIVIAQPIIDFDKTNTMSLNDNTEFIIELSLPKLYPMEPPLCTIQAEWISISQQVHSFCLSAVNDYFKVGLESLFDIIEFIRTNIAKQTFAKKIKFSQNDTTQLTEQSLRVNAETVNKKIHYIMSGEIITDRKSTFQAHICNVCTKEEVNEVLMELLTCPKIRKATHNIMAYRLSMNDTVKSAQLQQISENTTFCSHVNSIESSSLLYTGYVKNKNTKKNNSKITNDMKPLQSLRTLQGHDSDGETSAGGKLEYLLEAMNVTNIVVVVSRWYGGIQLGPIRFHHIMNCAKKIIEKTGIGNNNNHLNNSRK